MSRAKTERLLNLVICLLAASRYLSRAEIRLAVPGYSTSDDAFERAFERDKDELRDMGIPIETGSNDPLFDDEIGYRIRGDAYALPAVTFSPEEMAVLSLAAQAWQRAAIASAATSALLKLRAYGSDADDVGIAGLDPRIDTDEAAFLPLWQAVRDGRPVEFDYQRPGGELARRHVEPWGIVSWHGRWYLAGHDRDRAATRVFRLSRISGSVRVTGDAGSVRVPDGLDLRRVVTEAEPATRGGIARIRARAGSAAFLRRQATSVAAQAGGWDILEVPFADAERLADSVVGLGSAVVVLEPASVREAVVRRLRHVLAATDAVATDATEALESNR